MAKKGKDDFDEIDLDNMDDWDDFDEPPRQQDQSRNPVMDTFRAARKSALSTIWPENKRDQVILKGMPKPAAEAYEGYQNVKAAGQDILAHTKDEIEKTSRVVKMQARQLGPTLKRYLPESVTRKIDKWARNDQVDYGNYDPKQAMMDRELDSVFSGTPQTPDQQREMQEGMVEDRLRDTIKDMKSDALFQTVIGIAKDVNLTTSLSRGVMLNVQRKQLELQYRTLFALQDIAKLKQDEFARNTPALEAIVKNTALPDYAKEEFSEIRWANVKRKAAEWMNPLHYADNFIGQIRENAKKKISNIFSDGRGILEQVLGMAQEDDFDMSDSSSLSPERRSTNSRNKAAGFAGGWLAKRFLQPQIERLQNWTRGELEKNPEVMKRLQLAKYGFGNMSSISNSAIAGETSGPLADLFRLMHDLGLVNPLRRETLALDDRSAESLSAAAKFDRKAYLSITEVIPTLLSEINKSIRRGYGEHHDQVYDLTTRGMVDRKVIGNRVRKAVANDDQRKRLQSYINDTVDFIDKDKTLDRKTRQALADYIESRASEGKAFDVGSLLKDPMHMYRYMNANAVEAIQGVLEARSAELVGGHHELSNAISNKIAAIQSTIRARQDTVDAASVIYGENALRDSGIFKYDAKNDIFEVDKDINDPYTLFNDLSMGKTRSGRSLTREQEIQRKLQNGSALGDYLRRMGAGAEPSFEDKELSNVRGGGKGGRGRGLSARQLAAVLYGEKSTNFVELLSSRPDTNAGLEQQFDRLIDAVRKQSESNTVQDILKHVKNMDEEGVLLASLGGSRDSGDESESSSDSGTKRRRKRKRVVLGETGLLRRWAGVLWDTGSGVGRFGKNLFLSGKNRLQALGGFIRGRFSGGSSEGPGIFSRLKGLVTGTFSTGWNSAVAFGKGVLGVRDIYDERGNVVLQGSRLEAGEYYQADPKTEKLIQLKTLDDIKLGRDIVDEAGNLILAAADLAAAGKLRFYKGGKVQALFQYISGKAGTAVNKAVTLPKKLLGFISPKAASLFEKAREWLNEVPEGAEKTRLQSMISRVTGMPARLWNNAKRGFEKLKELASDNPLTRWWQNRKEGGSGGGFSVFSWSNGRKTNHILIRIYKLLNRRLPGEPEDDTWTEQMERNTGASSVKGLFQRAKDIRDGFREHFQGFRDWRGRMRDRMSRYRSAVGGRLSRWGGAARGWFDRFRGRASDMVDTFRDPRYDIGTRYRMESRLAGRDDDVAEFYRQHIYARGKVSKTRVIDAAKEDLDTITDSAGRVINKGKQKARSVGSALLERLNRMVNLQEMSWFNTMRDSAEKAGASDGLLRTMFSKFGQRNKPPASDEKRDYFQFFRRRRRSKEEEKAKKEAEKKGGKRGVMDFLKGLPLVGPIVSILGTVGSILGKVAKWGIFKPVGFAGKALWNVGKFAVTRLAVPAVSAVATAASAVVTAVGWPIIGLVAAGAALSWFAYKTATRVNAQYLDNMRLAQYGFRDHDEWSSDDGAKARYLEDNLKPYISYTENGQAQLRGLSGDDVKKLAEGFGTNVEDKGEMLAFTAFMLQRFVPIYLRWITALRSMDNDIALADVGNPSKVSKADMLTIFNKMKMTKDAPAFKSLTDPRKVNQGWFSKAWDFVTFTPAEFLTGEEVMEVQDLVFRSINMRRDEKRKETTGAGAVPEGHKVASVAESSQVLAKNDTERNETVAKAEGWEDGTEQVQIQVDWRALPEKKDLDAMESVRWKSYGVKSVNETTRTLFRLLEKEVLKDTDIKNCIYKGDWKKAISAIAPDAIGGPKEERYKNWFYNRFLPVFMTYVYGVKRYVPHADPLDLKLTGGFLYELALMMRGAYNMKGGIRQSVWEIAFNPLGGDANTDAGSVREELATLKELSKEPDLAVRNMLKETPSTAKRMTWKSPATNSSVHQTNEDSKERYKGINNYGEASNDGYLPKGGQSYGTPGDLSQVVGDMGIGNYAKYSTGQSGITLGELQDGDYKSLATKYPKEMLGKPMASNTEAIKSLIIDAANMVGIPPSVAIAMAQAESGLQYGNYPGASAGKPRSSKMTAAGLFQFTNGTWNGVMKQYARRYGIPQTDQFDPWANAILGVNFIRDNIKSAQKDLGGIAPPPAVAYLYHFLGPGGGAEFLKAWKTNPNGSPDKVKYITPDVLNGNEGVFYIMNGKKRVRMRTVGEVVEELNRRMGAVGTNEIAANPASVKNMTKGLSPVPSSPAMAAGAANDPSIAGPADNLPAANAENRSTALADKGAMGADDIKAATGGGPAVPSPGGDATPSDASAVAETVAQNARADGLGEDEVEVVKNKALQRAKQTAQPAPTVTSDAQTTPTVNSGDPISVQQLAVAKESAGYLKEIVTILRQRPQAMQPSPASSAASAPGSASRNIAVEQPARQLDVGRKRA